MSGFCGWIGGAALDDQQGVLRRMAARLPRYGACASDETAGSGFALASRVHPAMASFIAEPDVAAVVEGYPQWSDPALAAVARESGHAKALVEAYRTRGTDLFTRLHGAFSFAVLDLPARKALIAIDRLGIQTLCYVWIDSDTLVFGSSTDAVRAHPRVQSTIPVQSIFNFLYFVDRIPAPGTIYREQQKLVPGEYVLAEPGRCRAGRYWQMSYGEAGGVDARAAAEELCTRLRAAVTAATTGETAGRVGAFLSGGLDSSSMVGFAAECLNGELKTFTIGFPVRGFDETEYAELAATRFKTRHHVYRMQPQDVVEILQKAAAIYDEPFANLSMIPAFACARLAREHGVDLLLAGDGGDELFAGNERYHKDRIFDAFERIPLWLRGGLCRLAAAVPEVSLMGKAKRFAELATKSVPERMVGNFFSAVSPREIFTDQAWAEIDADAAREFAISIYDAPARADKVQRMMHFDLRITLADSDLRKVSRMCELADVRVRYPFLDDEVVRFSGGLPGSLLMKSGNLRQFYKDAMIGFLPGEILDKQKHGFGLPYMDFLASCEPLQALMCDGLSNLRKRHYFQAGYLDGLIGRIRGNALLGPDAMAWDLLMLELWLESRGRDG